MRWDDVHLEPLLGQDTHMFVCLKVMRCQSRHLVEHTSEIVSHFFLDRNLLLKQINVTHHGVFLTIKHFVIFRKRVTLLQVGNDGLMNLEPDVFFNFSAHWLDNLVAECFVDFFLVVVYRNIWLL